MCEAVNVSTSGYYAWLQREPCKRRLEDERLLVLVRACFAFHRRAYGSPRIARELRDESNESCSRHRIAKIMRDNGVVAVQKRCFRVTTDSQHAFPVAANVLEREFEVAEPNQVWLADITFISTEAGWLYLAVVMDLCSRMVVGWAADNRIDRFLALLALRRALRVRKPQAGWIHHSDQGSVYASDSIL